ncbi:hypothetical protein NIES267_54120 [Calothrix parasitica NIES-267]|uniref:Uncharacterized protein n=1 Tax=Calothrix parasitica NIES-267 TaxID=1973488 RepID=A0A1Z4LXB8_9CYAN|nr:hypothetical protein NIES267_54120 [Calothrix parasitica NIES-267]
MKIKSVITLNLNHVLLFNIEMLGYDVNQNYLLIIKYFCGSNPTYILHILNNKKIKKDGALRHD